MKKLGRNDPCWCGSGKKFKRCHLNRHQEDAPTIQERLHTTKRIYGKRYCLHPNRAECGGKIIKAHTIQRNGSLSKIAVDGHVYTFFPDHASMIKGDMPTVRSVGINNASTFTGFCRLHDNSTFEAIENHDLEPTKEQVFLFGYRAICREMFGKKAQLELIPHSREIDKGESFESQMQWQDLINYWEIAVKRGLQDIEHHKSRYDAVLQSRDYSEVFYYVIQIKETPDFMCSGAIQPDIDFSGKRIQSLVGDYREGVYTNSIETDLESISQNIFGAIELPDAIAFSMVGTDNGGAAIFTWIGESPACRQFVRSLDTLSDSKISHAIVRFAFHYFANIFSSPTWWDNLDEKIQANLLRRQYEGGISDTNPKSLMDDGIRAVFWRVRERFTNCD